MRSARNRLFSPALRLDAAAIRLFAHVTRAQVYVQNSNGTGDGLGSQLERLVSVMAGARLIGARAVIQPLSAIESNPGDGLDVDGLREAVLGTVNSWLLTHIGFESSASRTSVASRLDSSTRTWKVHAAAWSAVL